MSLKRASGFSLIEAVIVVAIIAVVLVAVGPDIGISIRNARLRNAAEAIQNGMQLARAEAIRRNVPVTFTLVSNLTNSCTASATSGSWIVSLDAPAGKCATAPSPTTDPRIVSLFNVQDGAASTSVSATANTLQFDGFGRAVGSAGITRVTVTNPTNPTTYREYRVEVNAAGAVRMCDARVSISSDDPRRCALPP